MTRATSIGLVASLFAGALACSSSPTTSAPAVGVGGSSTAGSAGHAGSANSSGGAGTNGNTAGAPSLGGSAGTAAAGSAGSGTLGGSGGSAGASVAGSAGASAAGSAGADAGSGGASAAGSAGADAGGAGGTAGGAAQAGAAGSASQTPAGLAVLSVPLALATDRAHFLIGLSSPINASAATITFHVNVHAGTGGIFQAYLQHGGSPDYNQFFQGWQPLSAISGWQDIVWDVASTANPDTFDETMVMRLGIEVAGGNAGTFSAATTDVLYVDSITVSGSTPAAGPWTFDTAADISATTYPAAGILWLNPASSDTTAVGASLTWLSAP